MSFSKVVLKNFIVVILWCEVFSRSVDEAPKLLSAMRQKLIDRYGFNEKLFIERSCQSEEEMPLVRCQRQRQPERQKRKVEPIFRGKPKPRHELLASKFHLNLFNDAQENSLVKLLHKIAAEYLSKCPPTIYYDTAIKKSEGRMLESLFKNFPLTFYHGSVDERYVPHNRKLSGHVDNNCRSYILFLTDPLMTRMLIGPQTESRVVVISRSSQWKLRDFLSSEASSNIVNLLVIGESLMTDYKRERPYVLYTHKLYTDGLGSNKPIVLTSWVKGLLSRPHINLFPEKLRHGFAGHRFKVAAHNQPPFTFHMKHLDARGSSQLKWEGIEYRLLNIIAEQLNFSTEIQKTHNGGVVKGIPNIIQQEIVNGYTDLGMSGIYITEERLYKTDMSVGHSQDCAAFITLASKALPKYRAIMGPFQWPVWVALTCIYLGAIFPIVFTDRLSLRHLVGNWGEIENMFWYVFGMFTNSFTFSGQYAWSQSQKISTRTLIGFYWLFTIIITACYTSSIIAFVTLPAFPDTVDSVQDLLGLFFRVGTLDNGGWEKWFHNSTHIPTAKLFQKMEYVSSLEEGIANVTQSFFWNYAFLGSKSQLEYLVQSNFSEENMSRRSALHLSEDCFAPFNIGYLFPKNAVYKHKIDSLILLAQQSGIINKINDDVKWAMQRSSSGKLLQASSSNIFVERIHQERQLTTADTVGMFLLMGIGYLLGAIALISEIVGGITNKCRQIIQRSRKSISSGWSSRKSSFGETLNHHHYNRNNKYNRVLYRRRMEAKEEHNRQNIGFGRREFNLTKTTLKELYGNYNKPEPKYSYVIRHGGISSEKREDSISADASESQSEHHIAIQGSFNKEDLALDKKAAVKEGDSQSAQSHQLDIDASLAALDNCLAPFFSDCISAESGGDTASYKTQTLSRSQSVLFGSYVGQEEELSELGELKLFDSEAELRYNEMENLS